MKIGFYGQIGQRFEGSATIDLPGEGISVTGLRRLLLERFDGVAILERSVCAAVNDEIVLDAHPVYPHDTGGFMSPVSGG